MSVFGSGHDPRVLGSSPASSSLLSGEPAFPSACWSPCLCMLSLSQIKKIIKIKGIQIAKEEVKLLLFADDMILYIEKLKAPPKAKTDK